MPYKFREIKKRLEICGFRILRQKGSHVYFSNGKKAISVPHHGNQDISVGVESEIIKAVKLTSKQFRNLK